MKDTNKKLRDMYGIINSFTKMGLYEDKIKRTAKYYSKIMGDSVQDMTKEMNSKIEKSYPVLQYNIFFKFT